MNSNLHHQLDQDQVIDQVAELRSQAQNLRIRLLASGRTPDPEPPRGEDCIEELELLQAHVGRLQEQLEGGSPLSGAAKIRADYDAAMEEATRALGLRKPSVAVDPAPAGREPETLTEECRVRLGQPLPPKPQGTLTQQCLAAKRR